MPVALLLLIAAGVGWAWWTGRLKGLTFEDGVAGAGGSAELAQRVTAARDTLVAEMNRRTPRAS